jgi:hypothetical protein
MEESLGLGKKSYGTKTDTETQSWFRLPIPKPVFGCTLTKIRCLSVTPFTIFFLYCTFLPFLSLTYVSSIFCFPAELSSAGVNVPP